MRGRSRAGKAYVAGAIGPLGIRIEPWGKTGKDEAEAFFREQAEALLAGGVDLFILETFRDLDEIRAAIAAIRSICDLPVVAQMTIEEDGNTLDGTPPETVRAGARAVRRHRRRQLQHRPGADARNHRADGGDHARAAVCAAERRPSARRRRSKHLSVVARNTSRLTPRRFISQGVRLVGGCCGTTPEHIRQITMAVKKSAPEVARVAARDSCGDSGRTVRALVAVIADQGVPACPRPSGRSLRARSSQGRFATIVQLTPPKGFVGDAMIESARALKAHGVDVVHIPDGQRGARMSALSLAVLIQQKAWIETVLQYSCRDRNLLGMQSDLLGAHAMGVRNLMIVTGDARTVGDYPDATAVFDVDSIGLTNVVSRLNHGLDIGGQAIGSPTAFHVGVQVNPGRGRPRQRDPPVRVQGRGGRRVRGDEAGVRRRHVRAVLSADRIREAADHPRPVAVRKRAERRVHGERGAGRPRAGCGARPHAPCCVAGSRAAEGVAIAREVGCALKGIVQGTHVAAPSGRIDAALEVLAGRADQTV